LAGKRQLQWKEKRKSVNPGRLHGVTLTLS
jgi:hypothetical protein